MRFWWLIPLVLVAVAAATGLGWWFARRAGQRSGKKGWVANSGYLRGLPKYQALVRRTRSSLAMAVVCFFIAVIATSVSAAAPVDRYVKHDKSASRDIVICLDASASMLPYDSKIGDAFKEIISHFEGERISLQLWNAYSMTMFPLSDDYDMATDVLQDMSETIDTGLTRIGGRLSVTQELIDYLMPVLDENLEVSSIVGDGLASCIMGFDHNDKQRSRTVLLATDNEVYGNGVYDLSEAIEFAKRQGVTVSALYPGSGFVLGHEAEQLRDEVRKTGGDFYDASSPSAVDSVVKQIEAEQKEDLDSAGKMLETDRPVTAMGWTLFGVVSLLGLLAFGRL